MLRAGGSIAVNILGHWWRVFLCLVAGAAVSVIVSWAIAARGRDYAIARGVIRERGPWPVAATATWPTRDEIWHGDGPGLRERLYATRSRAFMIREWETGFPLPCLSRVTIDVAVPVERFSVAIPTWIQRSPADRRIPLMPVFAGLAADSAFYGVFCAGILGIAHLLRARRRRSRGQCPRCGYDRAGAAGPCPECGAFPRTVRVRTPPEPASSAPAA